MTTPNNIAETVRALFADTSLLVKQEIALAKAEAGEKLQDVQTGLIGIIAGLFIAFVALMVLVQALVAALASLDFLNLSTASLLVGLVLAVVAFIAVSSGQSKLSASNLKPSRTIHSVREDAQTIREAA
ncbi:MAG: phage holin family protein [Pseudomonadota bacterium]